MPELENKRILIVDDEVEIRKGYRSFLNPEKVTTFLSSRTKNKTLPQASHEFEITEAENGEQALSIVQQEFAQGRRFAGAIVDVRMPGRIDGIQFIQAAWKIDPGLLVVIATAHQDRSVDEIDRMFGLDFQDQWDYLNKPFSSGEIIQKSRQLISSWNRRERERIYLNQIQEQQNALTHQEGLAGLGRLARSVGHEFGNILQQLITKLDLVKIRVESDSTAASLIEETIEAASLGANICQDLLTFAREKQNKSQRSVIKLDLLIQRAQRLLRHELQKKDVTLDLDIESGSTVYGHEPQIVQTLVNLMMNAMQAMKDGGNIKIKSRSQGNKLIVSIQDSGSGIAPEYVQHLFEPLFTTKGVSGNGLGLYVCKTIIENHDGKISIESQQGRGTIVTFELPKSA